MVFVIPEGNPLLTYLPLTTDHLPLNHSPHFTRFASWSIPFWCSTNPVARP